MKVSTMTFRAYVKAVRLLTATCVMVMAMSGASMAKEVVLFDFEQAEQIQAFEPDAERSESRRVSVEPPEVTADNKALKIVFTGKGTRWPGIATAKVPRDWSEYEALKFEAYSINPLTLSVIVNDDESVSYKTRFNYKTDMKERRNLIQIPTEAIGRNIDLKRIKLVAVFLTEPPAGTTIYVDNIRLGPLEAEKVKHVPFEQRKDAPYTYQVETPVAWKLKPLRAGPVQVFTIPSIAYGRETVELGQRLDAEFAVVTWDRTWGQNTWGLGDHYGQRGHRFDFKEVQKYLTMELAGPNRYDVYVIRTPVGWKWFPQAAREALLWRVKRGAGLVLVHPYSGDEQFDASDLWSLSALTHCATDTMQSPSGYMQVAKEGVVRGQSWRVVEPEHYIVKDLPLDLLPFKAMLHQQYRVAPDATVLVRSSGGDPIVAVKKFGKGRVVTLGYRAFDMTPEVDQPGGSPPPVDYAYWEVGYALMARCVLWAAGREEPFTLPQEFIRQARAQRSEPLVVTVPYAVPVGEPIPVKVALREGASDWSVEKLELRDTYGRLLGVRQVGAGSVALPSAKVGTWAARIVAYARNTDGDVVTKTANCVLTPKRAVWNDYEVIMWPNDRLPWQRPLIYEHMRQWGCTAVLDPRWDNDQLVQERLVNGLRIVPHGLQRKLLQVNSDQFAEQKQQWELTKDKKYLHRFMCISDPAVRASEEKLLRERTEKLARVRPLAYCIGEEDSLTSYRAELDLCFAPPTLVKFREHIKGKYGGDLAAVNKRWGTKFASWEAVVPMTSEDAKKHGNFAPWAEHRSFMDDEWVDLYFFYLRILQEVDHAEVMMGTSGTQVATPHDGQDWYKLMPAFNWLSSYTYGHQDEAHMNFARGKPYITAATGYGVSAERARHLLWDRLLHGNTGAIVFWWVAIQNPDLNFCQAGRDLGAVIGELKGGAGRLVFEADRLHDAIAVHYSMPSMQAAWITTGSMDAYSSAVDAWWMALQELGYQPTFVSSQQIEQGRLASGGYRALVMPRSVALSEKETGQIERMVEAGGVVLGSKIDVGRYDSDLVRRETATAPAEYEAIDPTAGAERIADVLGRAGIKPPISIESRSGTPLKGLEMVRFELDDMTLVGILRPPVGTRQVVGPDGVIRHVPDDSGGNQIEPVRITLEAVGEAFDARRGRQIDGVEQSGRRMIIETDLPAGDATLLAIIPQVARIGVQAEPKAVRPGQSVQISVSCDAPGRRVVRLQVTRPDGSDAPWLSRNLVVKGAEKFTSPVALDEQAGQWKVSVTEVVSGVSAVTQFSVSP